MVERVVATEAALTLIRQLQAQHGPDLMFYQSGGCCDGSAPMCYRIGELNPTRYDLMIGQIGGCNFFISQSQFEYWQHTQLIIDAVPGMNDNFSLEGSTGQAFLTRSRFYTDDELASLTPVESAG
jgi:uncharacterized protein (DUF779 family)